MELNNTRQEATSHCPLPSLSFSGRSKKQDARHSLWLADTILTSLKSRNEIQQILTGSKISTSSTKFVLNGPIRKTRWPPQPLICWDIFDFSSETIEWNSTKLDRKQDLNSLLVYQNCVSRAKWRNKMTAPASDLLSHFRILLWNQLTEFKETWQDALRSQCPLPSFCFSGQLGKKRWPPQPLIGWYILISPLKPLNGIQRNLTESKISTSCTKFVFTGRS